VINAITQAPDVGHPETTAFVVDAAHILYDTKDILKYKGY